MYQRLIIVGNLGRDPEMRYLSSGRAVTSFSVATSNTYTSGSGEKISETTWFRISVFGGQAESCNTYLHKGSRVLVEGRLKGDPETGNPRVYERNDGSFGASFEITAQSVRFLTSRAEDQSMQSGQGSQDEDEIPF